MYLVTLREQLGHAITRQLPLGIALVSLWLLVLSSIVPVVTAQSATPATYSIMPTASSVKPGSGVDITLTLKTDVALAGASVHIAYNNGSYGGHQSLESPALSFVDYHPEQDDLVFICNNNNCPPGTYPIAIIAATAGQTGNMTVTFTPKETYDPNLQPVASSGATGTYNILASAPASPPSKTKKNISTVPRDDGEGGTEPQQITSDELLEKIEEAQDRNEETAQPDDEDEDKSVWTPRNLVLAGLGIGIGFAVVLFLLLRLFGGGGPKGFSGPTGPSGGPGPTIHPN